MHSNIYIFVSSLFTVLIVISDIISVKLFKLPFINISIPTGIIITPFTFLISNFVVEVWGSKLARNMVYSSLSIAIINNIIIQFAIFLPSSQLDVQKSFQTILAPNTLILYSSLIAYFFSQIIEIQLYSQLKKWFTPLWIRNSLALSIALFFDTWIVNVLYLYFGLHLSLLDTWYILLFSYGFKLFFSLLNTPLLYVFLKTLKPVKTV